MNLLLHTKWEAGFLMLAVNYYYTCYYRPYLMKNVPRWLYKLNLFGNNLKFVLKD